jgi:hypothetical protein
MHPLLKSRAFLSGSLCLTREGAPASTKGRKSNQAVDATARKKLHDGLINATSIDADMPAGSGNNTRKNPPPISDIFYSVNADVANGTGGTHVKKRPMPALLLPQTPQHTLKNMEVGIIVQATVKNCPRNRPSIIVAISRGQPIIANTSPSLIMGGGGSFCPPWTLMMTIM